MFATLDPTVRHLTLPSRRKVLASDTVGFIRNLPTTLVKAFRATLEEVTEAALLLHVVDASSPSAPQHTAHVFEVLAGISAPIKRGRFWCSIKWIRWRAAVRRHRKPGAADPGRSESRRPHRSDSVSARTGAGFDALAPSHRQCLAAGSGIAPAVPASRPAKARSFIAPRARQSALQPVSRRCMRSGGGGPGVHEAAALRLPCRMIF
jgi:hypothetical protein